MASADENYRDSDGDPSDWIEITNSGDSEESLEGCYLTNNNDDHFHINFLKFLVYQHQKMYK